MEITRDGVLKPAGGADEQGKYCERRGKDAEPGYKTGLRWVMDRGVLFFNVAVKFGVLTHPKT